MYIVGRSRGKVCRLYSLSFSSVVKENIHHRHAHAFISSSSHVFFFFFFVFCVASLWFLSFVSSLDTFTRTYALSTHPFLRFTFIFLFFFFSRIKQKHTGKRPEVRVKQNRNRKRRKLFRARASRFCVCHSPITTKWSPS